MDIIDGKAIAGRLLAEVARDVETYSRRHGGARPALAVVQVGHDPASSIYVNRKLEAAKKVGIWSVEYRLEESDTQEDLLSLIDDLNADRSVNGILVQLPLPPHMDPLAALDRINPLKDVDGFHPVNIGRLSVGAEGLVPCTPLGCLRLLDTVIPDMRGMKAVVIGKSNIVGKPVAMLLLERECTVTVTHIATRNLPTLVSAADILVVAAGSPGLVPGGWVKPGAVVIDVGINRVTDRFGKSKIVGDVAYEEMAHARAVTPVPGGVGPMTVSCLMLNTLKAANLQAL